MHFLQNIRFALLFLPVLLSGCVIVENLKLMADGYDEYNSSASVSVYRMNNTPYYNGKSNYLIIADKSGKYIRYLVDIGSMRVGFPTVYMDDYSAVVKKLTMFIEWADKPYEERNSTLLKVQGALPQNNQKAAKGITDFYLFMNPDVNNNTPYLAYNRSDGGFGTVRYLMSKQDAEIIIRELAIWKSNSELKNKK
ncbi:TPA: hypothetical protein ACSEXO_003207 [Proteus mirabilis]|uniref:hypothetical protein n=1 Tax=Proteus mirabilis TaxID=584 RepID=UPI0018C77E6D|nr:hypothetical protein [Proteus mirabilis]MBG2743621.1 hypothetical protein [Proteus mirabilis]MDF7209589.1 hypothetical protein [Proteus mirabilis]